MSEIVLGSVLFVLIVLGLSLVVIGARALLLPAKDITVTVNESRNLSAKTGQRLLAVLADQGIPLPSTCGGVGTCGLCKIVIRGLGRDPLPTEVNKLTHLEVLAGTRLACQVVLRGNLAVEVPDELFEITDLTCTVRSNRMLTPLIKELVLDLPAEAKFHFRAGAFVQAAVPPFGLKFTDLEIAPEHEGTWQSLGLHRLSVKSARPVTRAYSIANRPIDAGQLVFNVRLALPPPGRDVPPGIASSYLFALKPGVTLKIVGPYGHFLAQESAREMVFIGGGVGMAPLRAMIFDLLDRAKSPRKITFWYGARSRAELFYADEFDRLQAQHANFRWTVALSNAKPQDRWDGATGFIHEVLYARLLKDHAAPEDCEYYLCGPPLMIKAVLTMLDRIGVDRQNIFSDDFGG